MTEPRPDRAALAKACEALPLFPLPGVCLLPGNLLPLHVFEPRYRQLVRDCVGGNTPLSVPEMLPGGEADTFGSPPVHPYAGIGVIAVHHARADGRMDIVLEPLGRVKIVGERHDVPQPYRVGVAELLEDEPAPTSELEKLGRRLQGLGVSMLARMGPERSGLAHALASLPPARVPDALAGLLLQGGEARQSFLAENNPLARAWQAEAAFLAILAEVGSRPAAEA